MLKCNFYKQGNSKNNNNNNNGLPEDCVVFTDLYKGGFKNNNRLTKRKETSRYLALTLNEIISQVDDKT